MHQDMNHQPVRVCHISKLRNAGLRPTRQRIALAQLLFANGGRHVTAEGLHGEALRANVAVSLATIMSHAIANSQPPPSAKPETAAITTFLILLKRSH